MIDPSICGRSCPIILGPGDKFYSDFLDGNNFYSGISTENGGRFSEKETPARILPAKTRYVGPPEAVDRKEGYMMNSEHFP
jgi:hypothetical protein